WLRLFGSYTESFRAPSINELYLDGQHFAIDLGPPFTANGPAVNTFVPNPDLIPEKLETVEFGIGFDFANIFAEGDAFQAKASYYETEAEDLIDISVLGGFPIAGCFDFNPFSPCNAGTTESRNVDNAEIDGFELEAIYESRRFRTKLSYSEIDGENADTGEDLGILTPDRLALDLRLKMYEWNAVFGTRLQFADDYEEKRFPSGSTVLTVVDERDSYAVVDLYAAWTPVFIDGLRFDVGVDNVFDEDYERVNEGVSEPGVNGKVAVSFRTGFSGLSPSTDY
ncbi:MAG: TonB-dependent receptor, partial [Pseudomonadota bacterium]